MTKIPLTTSVTLAGLMIAGLTTVADTAPLGAKAAIDPMLDKGACALSFSDTLETPKRATR